MPYTPSYLNALLSDGISLFPPLPQDDELSNSASKVQSTFWKVE